mmetsp:Transcript_35972/g.58165  ORF Transcript_35972/g.58165 Transcript_35972/m.58165 type:complete len:300 (+) Transcript_35972:86-985(+)
MSFADIKPKPSSPHFQTPKTANPSTLRQSNGRSLQTSSSAFAPVAPAPTHNGDVDYIKQSDIVTASIYQLTSNVNSIDKLLPSIGSSKDSQSCRERIHHLVEDTRAIVRETDQALKRMGLDIHAMDQHRAIQRRKLSKDFQQASKKFGEITRIYTDRLRRYPEPPLPPSNLTRASSRGEVEDLVVDSRRREQQALLDNEVRHNESVLQERQVAIRDVESKVREVNEIMRDLAVIVVDQGHLIDNIESNIVATNERTTAANSELVKANAHQKRSRNWLCALFILVGILALFLVLFLLKLI